MGLIFNIFGLVMGHVIVMGHFYNLPTGHVKYLYLHQHKLIDVEVIGNKNKPVGYWLAKVE